MLRRKTPRHENHDRWLVSYADFITLLFAFFVVMFATTQSDKNQAKAVSDSVREALQHGQFSSAIATVLGRGKHDARNAGPAKQEDAKPAESDPHPADLKKSLAELQQNLPEELKAGKVQLQLTGRGLVISLREAGFFASGDDAVELASLPTLERITGVIREGRNPMRLEGHTDAIPIHNSRFRSNWELSAARSIAMLELLSRRFGIDSGRLSVAGYGENAPADTNDTAEGRAHNRRVDLVVLSVAGAKAEPGH